MTVSREDLVRKTVHIEARAGLPPVEGPEAAPALAPVAALSRTLRWLEAQRSVPGVVSALLDALSARSTWRTPP